MNSLPSRGESELGGDRKFAQHLAALGLVERLTDLANAVDMLGVGLPPALGEEFRERVKGLRSAQVRKPEGDLLNTGLGVLRDGTAVAALQHQEHSPRADRVHGLVRGAGVAVVVVDDVDAVVRQSIEYLLLLVIDDKVRAEGLHHVDPRPRSRRHHPRRAERFRQLDADVPSAARPARDRHSEVLLRPGSASGAQAFKGGHPHHRHRARVHSRQTRGADARPVTVHNCILGIRTNSTTPHLVTHLEPGASFVRPDLHDTSCRVRPDQSLRAPVRGGEQAAWYLNNIHIHGVHTAPPDANEELVLARDRSVNVRLDRKAAPVGGLTAELPHLGCTHLAGNRPEGGHRHTQCHCGKHARSSTPQLSPASGPSIKYRN
eukprot:Hpha_TRINITY_DN15350_c3_g4::TRINITY_DN15350_c3_g4_i2::g.88846::m.88846